MVEPVLRFRASLIKVLVKIMDQIETIQKTAHLRSRPITFHNFGPPQVPQNEAGTGVVAQAAESKSRRTTASQVVFDRAHLAQYTMDSPELEREIVGLFVAQLPAILERLLNVSSRADWRIATHMLKGSALAIGAYKIGNLARKLEPINGLEQSEKRKKLISGLVRAVNEFDQMARQLYP
jgi:HPt (histidine-containing phosphotransfer) domain-containing protein